MSGSLLLWGMLALCVFWGVGLHNRLMRLRARGVSALGSVEKHMGVYAELLRHDLAGATVVQDAKPAPDAPPDVWTGLRSALLEFEEALNAIHARALPTDALAHLGQCFDAVQIAWRSLMEVPPDLAGPVVPLAMRTQWDTVTQRVETSRGGFNQILIQYNDALGQFPARMVAGWMGFKPCATI